MRQRRFLFLLIVAGVAALAPSPARAQGRIPDAPQITDMNPPSAQIGTSVDVLLSGQRLAGTKELMCRYSPYPELIAPAARGVSAQVTTANDGQVRAKITVAPDAASGLHEIRAITAAGVTNSTYFFVSQYPQVPEKEPNNRREQPNEVQLPVCVAGIVNGGQDEDVYTFTAKRGQRLIFDVEGFKKYAPPHLLPRLLHPAARFHGPRAGGG
jgi:hypothetical protein